MTFLEAKEVCEAGMFTEHPVEVRRRCWPAEHPGIMWDEATAEDIAADDWYIVEKG